MWLRRKDTHLLDEIFVCDNIKQPHEIQQRLEAGWVEVHPIWIKNRKTEQLLFVTHPEHQRRLLQEGGTRVPDPNQAKEDQAEPTAKPSREVLHKEVKR